MNNPPIKSITPLAWIRKNLFSSWYNGILTVVSLVFIYWLVKGIIHWAITVADWGVLTANLRLFFVGRYPVALLWRVWTTLAIIVGLGGISWGIFASKSRLFSVRSLIILGIIASTCVIATVAVSWHSSMLLLGILLLFVLASSIGKQLGIRFPFLGQWMSLIWLITFFILLWLLQGGLFLETVPLDSLSGLILTVLTASVSIVLCFPFGVLLALGRQSQLKVIRWLSIAYIEIIRGLPLLGILFMAQVMLPLVLPAEVRLDRVLRAISGYTIFASAYLAENVRGGLQSIPRGQTEAAKALGLNPLLVLTLVVLPQALKAVIPSIVGQFISLFKDTSLLAIVGLVDLLGISKSILANPRFIGRYGEVYLFIAAIYWICCYAMSLASRKLE